ncbi:B2 protein [Canna indica]|uniref:B2 protein n=1 Tax=Canna indica TaxID=4628 RepID=A0AAQ3QQU8_9LILI|nr:B2 protein [Canna indica]
MPADPIRRSGAQPRVFNTFLSVGASVVLWPEKSGERGRRGSLFPLSVHPSPPKVHGFSNCCPRSDLERRTPVCRRSPRCCRFEMDNLWQLGNDFRGQSKLSEDHQWSVITSKLAEMTRSKFDRMNNVDYSRNIFEGKPYEKIGFQEDNKFENINLSLMNLDFKMNETLIKNPLRSVYNLSNVYQKGNINDLSNFKMNTCVNNVSNMDINNNKSVNGSSNNNNDRSSPDGDNSSNNNNAFVDKRFKTLPASEMLPRNEVLGGYIFVCNNDTMQEDLKRLLFGLPPRYRDSVRAITPGLPLFLYNYTTHQLHGIFEAASFGGSNIDPTAWEDKKCKGESRFPAQVRIRVRKLCKPLEEDAFRPVLHHYDGPKFRLELSVTETLQLLDLCEKESM